MNKYWFAVTCLGFLILALASPVMSAFPETAHNIAPGYGGPIFAFEMAQNQADLIAVFGPESDPLRQIRIAEMNIGNLWDFPFMLAYSLFMAAFCFAVWKETRRGLWLLFASIGLLSGSADAIENTILLGLTENLSDALNIKWLGLFVWTKFISIMICTCACCAYIFMQNAIAWKAIGCLGFIGALSILAAFISPSKYGYLISLGTSTGWLSMLAFALRRSFSTQSLE